MTTQQVILAIAFLVWMAVIVGIIVYGQIKYRDYYKQINEEE